MTALNYLALLAAAILGLIIHISMVKYPSYVKRATAANMPPSLKRYLVLDGPAIIGSFASILLCLLALPEILHFKPEASSVKVTMFGLIGFAGSSIIVSFFGRASKEINKTVDFKTNVADGISNS